MGTYCYSFIVVVETLISRTLQETAGLLRFDAISRSVSIILSNKRRLFVNGKVVVNVETYRALSVARVHSISKVTMWVYKQAFSFISSMEETGSKFSSN